jgi:hypothetical protein
MKQQQNAAPSHIQHRPHVYTETERRLRWVLIIDAILSDPGTAAPQRDPTDIPPAGSPAKQTD